MRRLSLAAAVLVAIAGCASTQVDAQWTDPQHQLPRLSGLRVLSFCEAYEPVVQQLCQDRLDAELTARGATPVRNDALKADPTGRPLPDEQLLAAAKESGAAAVFVSTVAVGSRDVSQGFSIGIGGFGIGGGHVGGGVGVSAPIGGGRAVTGYVANGKLTDTASQRLVWTAKATTPASSDISAQMTSLSKALVDAAGKAGLF